MHGRESQPLTCRCEVPVCDVRNRELLCRYEMAQGEMVAQGPDLPIHLGSMPDAVRAVVGAFAADVHDGDVFIHNDPYFGGSHLPHVNVVRPAFLEGRLLGYACLRAHWPDVGSATPGSYGAVTQIFGEGLRIPPPAEAKVLPWRSETWSPVFR